MSLEAMQHRNKDEIVVGLQVGHDRHQHVVVQSDSTIRSISGWNSTQLVERCLDVAALQSGLCLDEVCNLIGLDEILVIHRLRIVLPVALGVVLVVVRCREDGGG